MKSLFREGKWFFFLVLVNGALKKNDLSYSESKMQQALEKIDSFYLGNGWYTDGPKGQLDYYVAFAFHFYGMIYASWFQDEFAKKFSKRAIIFSNQFQYWFDEQGRSLPFGRSLTYRFAHVCFWCELVMSGLYKKSDFSLGQVKGIIFRNFDSWKEYSITQPGENNLSVGYGYAQQLMAEDYNAQGSPMWAFKSFILLGLPADAIFWKTPEEPLKKQPLVIQNEPGFMLTSAKSQTIAYSARQFPTNPDLYCGANKYSKFAYSTYFGFNISRAKLGINNFALDSTLAFSIPGHDNFVNRNKIDHYEMFDNYSISHWHLWNDVFVKTYLIPLDGNSHLRLHELDVKVALSMVEGGFPILDWNHKYNSAIVTDHSVLATNHFGSSKIVDLFNNRQPQIIQQGPNTNIYNSEKNAVPALVTELQPGFFVYGCLCTGSVNQVDEIEVDVKVEDKNFVIITADNVLRIPRN